VVLRTAATWLWIHSLLTGAYAYASDHPATVLLALIGTGTAWAILAGRPPATGLCACGHTMATHEHYRRGSECSAAGCDCPRMHA
jgi:hypothetical protein